LVLVECEYENLKTLAPQTEKARSVIAKYAAENRSLIEDEWHKQKWFGLYAWIMFEEQIIEKRKTDLVETAKLFVHLGFVYQVPEAILDRLARIVLIRKNGLRNRSRLGEGLMPLLVAEDEGIEGSLAELLNEVALSHRLASDEQCQRIQNLQERVKEAEERLKLEKERTKNMPAMKIELERLEAEVDTLKANLKHKNDLIAALRSKQSSPVRHPPTHRGATPPSPGGTLRSPPPSSSPSSGLGSAHRTMPGGGTTSSLLRLPSPSSTSSGSDTPSHLPGTDTPPSSTPKKFTFKTPTDRRPPLTGIITTSLASPVTPVPFTPVPLSQTPLTPQSARVPSRSPRSRGSE